METLDINKKLMNSVFRNEILLPDFQREFVWNEEKQIKLIASLFAKLPIGSFLLFPGKSGEYRAKKLGNKKREIFMDDNLDVNYLLDGQQRLTSLTNSLSNKIFSNNEISEVYPELKKRFFLKLEREKYNEDIFGCERLIFPFVPDSTPDFLPLDIENRILTVQLKDSNTNELFHPYNEIFKNNPTFYMASLSTIGSNSCGAVFDPNFFYIPIFMICEKDFDMNKYLSYYSGYRVEQILKIYTEGKKRRAINYLDGADSFSEEITNSYLNDYIKFQDVLYKQSDIWKDNMNKYLVSCVEKSISSIILPTSSKDNRSRAISIYENLNMGGVSLSTFDLIIAKAAKSVTSDYVNFQNRLKSEMKEKLNNPKYLEGALKYPREWNAEQYAGVFDNRKNLKSKFIKIFLNVLSLVSYIDDIHNIAQIKSEFIKKDSILALSPEQIINNYKSACLGISRGLQFLQYNCGLRNISEINYDHILTILALFLIDDSIYNDLQKSKILDGWYWTVIFSGNFNTDQNTRLQENIQLLSELLYNNKGKKKLYDIKSTVLKTKNFSDKDTLLMNTAVIPKSVLKIAICQFVLKDGVYKLFGENEDEIIYAWDWKEKCYEYHHIIPLGQSDEIVKTSTSKLRKDSTHILNSPINFVLITRDANNRISSQPVSFYMNMIGRYNHKTSYMFDFDFDDNTSFDEQRSRDALSKRFNIFESKLKDHLNNCFSNVDRYQE